MQWCSSARARSFSDPGSTKRHFERPSHLTRGKKTVTRVMYPGGGGGGTSPRALWFKKEPAVNPSKPPFGSKRGPLDHHSKTYPDDRWLKWVFNRYVSCKHVLLISTYHLGMVPFSPCAPASLTPPRGPQTHVHPYCAYRGCLGRSKVMQRDGNQNHKKHLLVFPFVPFGDNLVAGA